MPKKFWNIQRNPFSGIGETYTSLRSYTNYIADSEYLKTLDPSKYSQNLHISAVQILSGVTSYYKELYFFGGDMSIS